MIEVERGPRKNPDYEAQGNWMYYPKGYWATTPEFKANFPTWNQEAFTKMSDGEQVIYKYHICPSPDEYLIRTRKIIVNFLHKNQIMHKTVSNKHGEFDRTVNDETHPQYGKPFTVYTGTLEEFYIIAKGIKELVTKYSIKGIPKSKFKELKSNMRYERVVPDTNNVLYYTVEKATKAAVEKAVSKIRPEYIAGEPKKKPMWVRVDGAEGAVGGTAGASGYTTDDGTAVLYLGGNPLSYALREPVMDYYMGEGPMDFLF